MKEELEKYFDKLWPINRSLTGEGNRESLQILSELVDLEIMEVPSGTKCLDWTVPPEWNVREAWIKDSKGNKIIDFADSNLHVLGYSIPVRARYTFEELKPHLYTLPDQPDVIPYLTSYYQRRWGFCLSHDQFQSMDESAEYEVYIDSTLDDNGSMTVGEAVLEGQSEKEVVISTYICHPSLANNELSGPLVAAFIYHQLKQKKELKYTYRFLFVPETIGSIYMLSVYGEHWIKNMMAGFIITCTGDDSPFTYKKSRQGSSLADRVVEEVLKQSGKNFKLVDFSPRGSDERQYCSPGFNLPVGSLMRTMYGQYEAYHTSADNKDFISFTAMEDSVFKYLEIIEVIEKNEKYINTMPYGEPQLGKRGLYPTLRKKKDSEEFLDAMMWILNLADGKHDLINISQRSKIPIKQLIPVVKILLEDGILKNPFIAELKRHEAF
jgi:aminopeptidase-like protein